MSTAFHVYTGTAGHSAWFSEDAGLTWVHPNSHSGMYLEARVWTFASHPSQDDTLYAGTDMGIFRWSETTARWTALPSPMKTYGRLPFTLTTLIPWWPARDRRPSTARGMLAPLGKL